MNPLVRVVHLFHRLRVLIDKNYFTEYLRRQGVQIGPHSSVLYPSYVDGRLPYLLEIGDHVVVSRGVTILTHDASSAWAGDLIKVGRVTIKDNCFIGANTTILCNVTIGPNAVVGAGSVVSRDIPPGTVCAGNPARVICPLEEFVAKHRTMSRDLPVFKSASFPHPYIDDSLKCALKDALRDTFGYFCTRLPEGRTDNEP